MSTDQLENFKLHFAASETYNQPEWAKGLSWYIENKDAIDYEECSWDFGLTADGYLHRRNLDLCGDLLERLNRRYYALKDLYG